MKIAINIESLNHHPIAGIGNYVQHLIAGLIANPVVDTIYGFDGSQWLELDAEVYSYIMSRKKSSNLNKVKHYLRQIPFSYELQHYIKNKLFTTNTPTVDLYHDPSYLSYTCTGKNIITVHDLSHIHHPEYHPPERVKFLNKYLLQKIQTASHITTVSEFSAKQIVEKIPCAENKVTSIHLGVNTEYQPRTSEQVGSTLDKYHLEYGGYILSVATLEPRKNLNTLIDSYLQLDPDVQQAYPLVLVGANGWKNTALLRRIDILVAQGIIKKLNYVTNSDLVNLYSGARACVFIPHYEGFGLPVLEAMASGVPVVAADIPSIIEIVGYNNDVLVNAADKDAIANKIQRALEDEAWRDRVVQNGLLRAKRFTWDKFIRENIRVYKKVLNYYRPYTSSKRTISSSPT